MVHCTAGKDRTGVLVALMLSLAGVKDAEVAREYALTEVGLKDWMFEYIGRVLESGFFGRDEEKVRSALGARKEVMKEFLEMLGSKYGGAEGYVRDYLGFSEEEVRKIKENLVEEVKERRESKNQIR